MSARAWAVCLTAAGAAAPHAAAAQAVQSIGLMGARSMANRYLQAHTEGELHASNPQRNEEETWVLVQVDPSNNVYALLNWKNARFLSKQRGCAPAVATSIGPSEQWVIVPGSAYSIANAAPTEITVAFRNVADGTYLVTNGPGNDTGCGGEVSATGRAGPPAADGGWGGWWLVDGASKPTSGTPGVIHNVFTPITQIYGSHLYTEASLKVADLRVTLAAKTGATSRDALRAGGSGSGTPSTPRPAYRPPVPR